jgi:hypothetical protein
MASASSSEPVAAGQPLAALAVAGVQRGSISFRISLYQKSLSYGSQGIGGMST